MDTQVNQKPEFKPHSDLLYNYNFYKPIIDEFFNKLYKKFHLIDPNSSASTKNSTSAYYSYDTDILANKLAFDPKIYPNVHFLLHPYHTLEEFRGFPVDKILNKIFPFFDNFNSPQNCISEDSETKIQYIGPDNPVEKKEKNKHQNFNAFIRIDPKTRTLILAHNMNLSYEDTVLVIPIENIKEVRLGKRNCPHDIHREPVSNIYKSKQLLSILYGNKFNLNYITIYFENKEKFDLWRQTLGIFLLENINQPTIIRQKVWLNRLNYDDFSKDFNKKFNFDLKNDKIYAAARLNFKIPKKSSLSKNNESLMKNLPDYESFLNFCFSLKQNDLIQKFIEQTFHDEFHEIRVPVEKSGQNQSQDHDASSNDPETSSSTAVNMKLYLQKNHAFSDKQIKKLPNFKNLEKFKFNDFINYLFSWENSIYDSAFINDFDMHDLERKSLVDYYIYSSHNTYLTADQVKGTSSEECYARVLNMGCRCVELDCHNGDDGVPIIFHGLTFTSKISFKSTLEIIKHCAFSTTPLPLVLSIENHANYNQQLHMASLFQEIFGDALVVKQVDENEEDLPSPSDLRQKIIVKWKSLDGKIKKHSGASMGGSAGPLSAQSLTGGSGSGHFTSERLSFNGSVLSHFEDTAVIKEVTINNKRYEVKILSNSKQIKFTEYSDIFKYESKIKPHNDKFWYHEHLDKSNMKNKSVMKLFGDEPGNYLVRRSHTVKDNYVLEVLCDDTEYDGRYYHGYDRHLTIRPFLIHVRISKLTSQNGDSVDCKMSTNRNSHQTTYYLQQKFTFDSISALLDHYKKYPIHEKFYKNLKLKNPVINQLSHREANWFHKNLNKHQVKLALIKNKVKNDCIIWEDSSRVVEDCLNYMTVFNLRKPIYQVMISVLVDYNSIMHYNVGPHVDKNGQLRFKGVVVVFLFVLWGFILAHTYIQ